jgi:hypothetical protein
MMKRFENLVLLILPYLLILGVAMLRLQLANPFNIVPVFSCLLFFAAVRPAREMVLPLALLVGVDIFITTHRYGYAVTADSAVTWAWYVVAMLLGAGVLSTSRSWQRVAGCSLAASISFFMVSNFTVWAAWQMYPKTLAGLGACYVAALPFFRNAVTSELCFSLLLFALASRLASLATAPSAGKAHC